MALPQTVFKVEADSLHLTLVGRFLYDVMHFVTEAREIASVLSTSEPGAPKSSPQQPADSYRTLTEVISLLFSSCHCFFGGVHCSAEEIFMQLVIWISACKSVLPCLATLTEAVA